uniref:Uncharacterized protein n=1 Tax=Pipistrellus kuhlii TaxID=59472 RepID=A0A7J7ZIU5_PIPKU|nr:hypothetical protein mPipKuh1_009421 [Pipistrellus kuhlii]
MWDTVGAGWTLERWAKGCLESKRKNHLFSEFFPPYLRRMPILLRPESSSAPPSFPKACKFCPEIPRSPTITAATPGWHRTDGSGGAGGSAAGGKLGSGAARGFPGAGEALGGTGAHLHFGDLCRLHLSASLGRCALPRVPGARRLGNRERGSP